MKDWSKVLGQRGMVARLNSNFAESLPHCPTLDGSGGSFRCVECHVASGAYRKGDGWNWHSHGEYQLEIPLAGAFSFEMEGGKRTVLRPGHVLFLPGNFAHRWTCLRPGPMLGISLELLATPKSGRRDMEAIDNFEALFAPAFRRHAGEVVQLALDPGLATSPAKAIACRLFLLLVEVFDRLHPRKGAVVPARAKQGIDIRARETVARVVAHLNEHFAADISLRQIAHSFDLSSRHLHRLFLKCMGKSLHDHLLDLRLDHARRLLMEKDRDAMIKEIAFRCGFNSSAYFSSSFRRAFGVPPLAYRATHGGGRPCFTVPLHADPWGRERALPGKPRTAGRPRRTKAPAGRTSRAGFSRYALSDKK